MTGSTDPEMWVICDKCTGLLSTQDEDHVRQHISSCDGDLGTSTCEQFAVDKTTLLELLVPNEMPNEQAVLSDKADVVGSKNTQGTKKRGRKRKQKTANENEDFVPVAVKREKVEDDTSEVGTVRRSKRKPKPKKRDDSVEDTENKNGENEETTVVQGESTEKEAPVASESVSGTCKHLLSSSGIEIDPAIGVTEMECETVESATSAAIEAIIMTHPKTEAEEIPKVDDPLVSGKFELVENENESSKKKYLDWKQNLAEEYAEYREESKDEKGNTEQVYRCPKCTTRTFPSRHVGMFGRHLRTCKPSGSEDLKCPEPDCTYVAKDAKRFSEHKRYHLQPYMCEYCPRRFADKRNMKEHCMTHTDERPLACAHCEYRTRNKRLLKEHMRKHSGEFLHCPESGCGFFTPYQGSLASHIELRHREHTKHQCPQCEYVTNSRANYKRHVASHEMEGSGEAAATSKLFQCSLCSYKAVSKFAVISHIRSHTKEKIYFCNRCDYSASYSSAFRQHMMTHLGLKTWQCGPCGYNSNTRAKVYRHLQNKHPDVDPASSVVNLGLSLKLDLSKFRRQNENQKYVISMEEVTVPEVENIQGHQVMEQVEDVGGEEIVISEEIIGDGTHELIVMTENGNIVKIPPNADLEGMVVEEVLFEEGDQSENVVQIDGIQLEKDAQSSNIVQVDVH